MKTTIWMVSGALVVVGSTFAIHQWNERERASATRAVPAPADAARETPVTAAMVRRVLETATPAANTVPAEAPVEHRPNSQSDEAGEHPVPPAAMEPEEIRVRIGSRFEDEQPDRAWTSTAEELVRTRLAPRLPEGSTLISVECRSSMCRLLSAHSGPDSYKKFLEAAFKNPESQPWNGASFATPTPERDRDGNVITVAYLAREGQGRTFMEATTE